MSTTPRTDASQFGTGRVSVSFARDLEKENNDLREVLTKLTDCYFMHRCEGMLELMMQADRLRPLDMEGDK
jgi:hypothetical protein